MNHSSDIINLLIVSCIALLLRTVWEHIPTLIAYNSNTKPLKLCHIMRMLKYPNLDIGLVSIRYYICRKS